jgi:hypothetical protein
VARILVEKKWATREDYARQTLRDLPYGRWREFNPEDTVRFYALRLHEAGMVKASPQKIIAQGTDWRFINELKQEMAYFPPADRSPSAFALDCAIDAPPDGPALAVAAGPGSVREEEES